MNFYEELKRLGARVTIRDEEDGKISVIQLGGRGGQSEGEAGEDGASLDGGVGGKGGEGG